MDEASIRSKMQQVLELVSSDIAGIRTGRATSALIEDLVVGVYGNTQKLSVKELVTISIPDTQTIILDPWDKSIIGEIRQGILAANIGMNPAIDGEIIRINLPLLTTEDREKFIKLLSGKLETGRVMVRQVRAEGMKDIKLKFEKKELTEDEKFDEERNLQEVTDEFIAKIEEMGERKKVELQTI